MRIVEEGRTEPSGRLRGANSGFPQLATVLAGVQDKWHFSHLPVLLSCILTGPLLPLGVLLCQLPAPPRGPWAVRPNRLGPAAYLCRCGAVWSISVGILLFPAGSGNLAARPASNLSDLACQPMPTLTRSGLLKCVMVSFICAQNSTKPHGKRLE